MTGATLTGADNFLEDFTVGRTFRHWRGKTVTDFETMTLCTLVMNTANGHFNSHAMRDSEFGTAITFGGIVASIVYGLVSQDTAEQAVREAGVHSIRFVKPTRSGNTIYAHTEVLAVDDDTDTVRFRHTGVNEDGDTVCLIERSVVLRRRPSSSDA